MIGFVCIEIGKVIGFDFSSFMNHFYILHRDSLRVSRRVINYVLLTMVKQFEQLL